MCLINTAHIYTVIVIQFVNVVRVEKVDLYYTFLNLRIFLYLLDSALRQMFFVCFLFCFVFSHENTKEHGC